jgi:hypothetical protein
MAGVARSEQYWMMIENSQTSRVSQLFGGSGALITSVQANRLLIGYSLIRLPDQATESALSRDIIRQVARKYAGSLSS